MIEIGWEIPLMRVVNFLFYQFFSCSTLPDHARPWSWREKVRVMQERSSYGRIPVAGRLPFSKRGWVIAALGARGLIHHAYLGKLVAACALLDSDDCLPPQVVAPLEDLGKETTGDL